jgi:site-specific recombinase XerD
MRDRTLIGPWIRRFLLEHLVSDRNLTRNTQASYRDTLLLLLPFVSQAQKKPTDRLMIDDLSSARLRSFLEYLEKERGCSAPGTGWSQFRAARRDYARALPRNRRFPAPPRCGLGLDDRATRREADHPLD